jgi:ribonucleotide monophosphatase NagD (HAD superfamily)
VFLIGELGFRNEIEAAGFVVVADDSTQTTMTDNEFSSYTLDPTVKAVVVGIDMSFSYKRLCIASLYVQAGCKLIASNKDRNTTNRKGDYHPGGGCIVKAIETAS